MNLIIEKKHNMTARSKKHVKQKCYKDTKADKVCTNKCPNTEKQKTPIPVQYKNNTNLKAIKLGKIERA